MSRPIKFRFWSPNEELFKAVDGKMVGKIGNFISPSRIEFNENGEPFDLHGEPIVYQQFTGLLDENGREIYEGDKVKVKRCGSCTVIKNGKIDSEFKELGEETGEVLWWQGQFLVSYPRYDDMEELMFVPHRNEVVGNIFE